MCSVKDDTPREVARPSARRPLAVIFVAGTDPLDIAQATFFVLHLRVYTNSTGLSVSVLNRAILQTLDVASIFGWKNAALTVFGNILFLHHIQVLLGINIQPQQFWY